MVEQTYQRLNGDKNRLERAISNVNRSINLNKRFAQDVDVSEKFRAKKLKELRDDEKTLKDLNAKLKDVTDALDEIEKQKRSEQGKKDIDKIETEYARLQKALDLQLDPNSKEAKDIKKKIDSLVGDYASALSASEDRAINKVEARAKLTDSSSLILGAGTRTSSESDKVKTPVESGAELLSKPSTGGTKSSTSSSTSSGTKTSTPSKATTFTEPMTISGQVKTDVADANKQAAGLNAAAVLDLAGTLFEHVPSLKALLDNYVSQNWTDARFLQELRNDPWYKKNSAEIKARYTQLYNYQDLVATGQADGSTDYEKQIRSLKDQVLKKARAMGSGLASDPAAIQRIAENMYITNTDIEDALTNNLIAAGIRTMGSTIAGKPTEGYSGQALKDYQNLQKIAKSNGFTMADIIPGGSNEQQVLQNIATGAIDINRIAQDARRLAAQGQPQYVRDLLGQGYNLDQVYAPYRQTMANILEIGDPDQISLNDPTLRMAISDKGDMNLYDFKKALRQDNRWQYTDTAKKEVSDAAISVLRDFGFQG